MEIQKHLFKISERALKSPNAVCIWKGVFYFMVVIACYSTLTLIFGHTLVLPNNHDLQNCLTSAQLTPNNESLYFVNQGELQQQLAMANTLHKTVLITSQCTIILNNNYTESIDYMVTFGWDQVALYMDRQKRDELNYDNYTIMLKKVKPMRSFLFGFDTLIANQMLSQPNPDTQNALIVKSRFVYVHHIDNVITVWDKMYYLGKVILIFVVVSIVTTLYIYGTIVSAPAVIILILKACNTIQGEGFNDVYRLFPWIGTHAIIRDTSPNPSFKQSASQICKAMLLYFFLLYLIYYSVIIWIDKKMYQTHVEAGLQQLVFGFIAVSQFVAIIFMRTRTFIKYYPSIHCLLIVTLLYYGQVCDYGFKKLVCYWAFSLSGVLFSWMVINLEIPAFNTWDREGVNTPREDRPRAGYSPLFSMNWIKNLPEEWTLMMPLFGREHYTPRELALVDRNTDELALILGNR